MKEPARYIRAAPKLRVLLERQRASNIKTFLLTNSDYVYRCMTRSFWRLIRVCSRDWQQLRHDVFAGRRMEDFLRLHHCQVTRVD